MNDLYKGAVIVKLIDLRLEILNTMADDGENIETIEDMLRNISDVVASKDHIVKIIADLLKDGSIYIRYPQNVQPDDFLDSTGEKLYDFWFEMTNKGRAEWDNANSYFYEQD